MDEEKVKKIVEKYGLSEEKAKEMLKPKTQKEMVNIMRKNIEKDGIKKFELKKWCPSNENSDWSHDHCEICNKEISDKKGAENEGYANEENFYWICTSCFKQHHKELGL